MSTFNEWTPRRGYLPALSIRQPWAWLIVNRYKDIENRDWKTTYRGPLLIHAGKVFDADIMNDMTARWIAKTLPEHWKAAWESEAMPSRAMDYPTGGIVGIATLGNVVKSSASPWFVGPYGFVLRHARSLPFMRWSGALGLFAVPDIALGGNALTDLIDTPEEGEVICVRTAPTQPITGWAIGDDCRIDGYYIGCAGGRMYDARILTLAHKNNIQMAELHITATVPGFDGQPVKQSWTHPKFVPTSKLRKALLK